MKIYYLLTLSLILSTLSISAQYKSLDPNDTTNYEELKDLKELEEFGYNYLDKNLVISCKFEEISNSYLSSTPEANRGVSSSGTYYNREVLQKLVGFQISIPEGGDSYKSEYFYNNYGLQTDILEKLKSLKEGDDIIVFGKVVKWTGGEDVGLRVKYIYTANEYNSTASGTTENSEATTDAKTESAKISTDSGSSNKLMNYLKYFAIGALIVAGFNWIKSKFNSGDNS